MGLLGNMFKKKDPTPEDEWKAFCKKLNADNLKALNKLGIDSLNKLDRIPMNLLHITDFSNENLQWLEPVKATILDDPHLGWRLNFILHTRFDSRYNSTPLTAGDMAWWWLCTNYSLIDQVTSTIHRGNAHEFMLCSTCIYVADDFREINYYMAPDIVKTGRDQMYLGYSEHDTDHYLERRDIRFVWNDIAYAFPKGDPPSYSLEHLDDVHAYISRTRGGFGWRW